MPKTVPTKKRTIYNATAPAPGVRSSAFASASASETEHMKRTLPARRNLTRNEYSVLRRSYNCYELFARKVIPRFSSERIVVKGEDLAKQTKLYDILT